MSQWNNFFDTLPPRFFLCDLIYSDGYRDTSSHMHTQTGWHALIHLPNMCFFAVKTVHKYKYSKNNNNSSNGSKSMKEEIKKIRRCRRIRNAGWQFYALHRIFISIHVCVVCDMCVAYMCSTFDTYSINVSLLATSQEHLQ